MTIKDFIERAGYYFNLMPDKEDEQAIVARITEGVSFKGANLWVQREYAIVILYLYESLHFICSNAAWPDAV
ncbi:MAG: hypothetical protein K6B13_06960 [Prevotella sp.]|nr:hypothetical protein [Prevotella sp.]